MKLYINSVLCIIFFMMVMGVTTLRAEAGACYTMDELEAEQAIRIHSELMVIGLNCHTMVKPGFPNIYVQYKTYTHENEALFSRYEDVLIHYFRRNGHAAPQRAFNDLRTSLANRISKDAASMRPDIFCAAYSPRIPQVVQLSQEEFRQWARTVFPGHPVSRPLCAGM